MDHETSAILAEINNDIQEFRDMADEICQKKDDLSSGSSTEAPPDSSEKKEGQHSEEHSEGSMYIGRGEVSIHYS